MHASRSSGKLCRIKLETIRLVLAFSPSASARRFARSSARIDRRQFLMSSQLSIMQSWLPLEAGQSLDHVARVWHAPIPI